MTAKTLPQLSLAPIERNQGRAAPRPPLSATALTVGRALEYGYAATAFLVASYALALQPLWQGRLWLAIYGLTLLLIVLNYAAFLEALSRSRLLLCWPAMALLSLAWSEAPDQTLRFALQLLMTILVSVYIGARFTLRQITWTVFVVLSAAALASLGSIALKLGFAIDHNGIPRGIFPHKNALGGRMVFLLACCLAIAFSARYRPAPTIMAVLAVLLIGLSQSATAVLMAAVVLGATPLFLLSRGGAYAVLLAALAVLAISSLGIWVVLSFGLDPMAMLLVALGKEETLSGRALIWEFARALIAERPLLGHGYSAIWVSDPASIGSFVQTVIKQEIQSFHNSYLDILVQLGAAGLVVTAALLGALALAAARALAGPGDFIRALPAYVTVLVVLYSLSEYAIFRQHAFIQLLLGALYVALAMRRRGQPA